MIRHFLTLLSLSPLVHASDFKALLEQKYEVKLAHYQEVKITKNVLAIRYDWEQDWWGSFCIIKTNNDGSLLFWYDIDDVVTAQCVNSLTTISINGKTYLQVIDKTHMGNGHLHLFKLDKGHANCILSTKVWFTAEQRGELELDCRMAKIQWRDLNNDGLIDLTTTVPTLTTKEIVNIDTKQEKIVAQQLTRTKTFHQHQRGFVESPRLDKTK